MNINSIKPNSSTILVLNYLGMRKRCKNQWTTAVQVADFFPHVFRKRRSLKGSDATTVMNRLVEAGFLNLRIVNDIKEYSITKLGSDVPFRVAQRIKNSPYYVRPSED